MKAKIIKKKILKSRSQQEVSVPIDTPFIKLDALLKFAAVADTGGLAKQWIQEGNVQVNGEVCVQRGKKIFPGDIVTFQGFRLTVLKREQK